MPRSCNSSLQDLLDVHKQPRRQWGGGGGGGGGAAPAAAETAHRHDIVGEAVRKVQAQRPRQPPRPRGSAYLIHLAVQPARSVTANGMVEHKQCIPCA